MLLQSPVMRERPLIWTILHYMDDETTILMLIILFYKFVNFFDFLKPEWSERGVAWSQGGVTRVRIHGREKTTRDWKKSQWYECRWFLSSLSATGWLANDLPGLPSGDLPWLPPCDRFWWPTLTLIWWPDYGDLYLDCHKTSRLPGQAPSPLAPAAVCHHYHQCQYQIEDHRIPNTEDYQMINPGSLRIINIEDHLPKTRLLMNSSREVVKKAKSEEWINVIMMMDCQPAGECLGESVTTSLHHTIIFLGKTFHLGGNWVKSVIHLLNIYHGTMIYNIYLRDHDIMIYISHNNLSQKNLPPWWNNGSRQTNY